MVIYLYATSSIVNQQERLSKKKKRISKNAPAALLCVEASAAGRRQEKALRVANRWLKKNPVYSVHEHVDHPPPPNKVC